MHIPSRSAFLASAGAGLAAAALPLGALAQASTTIRVAAGATDVYSEPYYAAAAGTFAKHNLQIDAGFYNVATAAAAIAGGSLELSVGDLISGVSAIAAGLPVVILAGSGLYQAPADRAGNVLAVAPGSPIQAPKDFVGKTIGVPSLVGLTTACLHAWLPAHGVPLSSVHLTEVPAASMVPGLERGTIDVALLSEPFVILGKKDLRVVGYPFDVLTDHAVNHEFCFSVWYASKAWVELDRDRARRCVQAIYDTARWANAHRDETFALLVKNRKLDADKVQGMTRVTFATSLSIDLIAPVIELGNQQNIYPKPVDVNALIANLS